MKNLLSLFLALAMILTWSCYDDEKLIDEEVITNNQCANDYAEYHYNGTLFSTIYTPGGGEITNPDGDNCGIGAALNEDNNILTMRIFVEDKHFNMHTEITNLNEELKFRYLQINDNNIISTFQNILLDNENFILIEELDTAAKTIKGVFKFKFENSTGDTITVTDGSFNCSYRSF